LIPSTKTTTTAPFSAFQPAILQSNANAALLTGDGHGGHQLQQHGIRYRSSSCKVPEADFDDYARRSAMPRSCLSFSASVRTFTPVLIHLAMQHGNPAGELPRRSGRSPVRSSSTIDITGLGQRQNSSIVKRLAVMRERHFTFSIPIGDAEQRAPELREEEA